MKYVRCVWIALMLVLPCSIIEAGTAIKGEVSYKRLVTLTADGLPAKSGVLWTIVPLDGQNEDDVEWATPMKGATVKWTAPRGRYKVIVNVVTILPDGSPDLSIAYKTLTITGDTGPPTPVPPGPGPTPVPPGPNPSPAPIADAGLRVLIVYDATAPRTSAVEGILKGKDVRDYLNTKCALDADGKTRAYRIWDKGVDPSGSDKIWIDAFARKRDSAPWVLISNGKTGFEGPLPATSADLLALLKKYEVSP